MARNFEPLHPVTLYQARCTNCGAIEDEYGDFSCMTDDMVITSVWENGWFKREGRDGEVVELLCPDCQKCDACGNVRCYDNGTGHLVCSEHEDNFTQMSLSIPDGDD